MTSTLITEEPLDLGLVEQAMLAAPIESQFLPETIHHHSPGIYTREMRAPAGSLIIGHKHLKDHINVLLKGSILALVDGEKKRIDGPKFWISKPGRKICYTLTDIVWMNMHAVDTEDLKVIESQHISKSEAFMAVEHEFICNLPRIGQGGEV